MVTQVVLAEVLTQITEEEKMHTAFSSTLVRAKGQ
jgi:hypothetical protein